MKLAHLDPRILAANERNPRGDLGDLTELTASITAQGVLQPLLATEPSDSIQTETGRADYRIIAGHRRAAAAIAAGLDTVPVIVVAPNEYDAASSIEAALAENLHRADLTLADQVHAVQELLDLGIDAAAIAARTGLTKVRAKRLAGVAAAGETVRDIVATTQLTLDEAAVLGDYAEYPTILALLQRNVGTPSFAYATERAAAEKPRIDLVRARVAALTEQGTNAHNAIEQARPDDWKEARGWELGLDAADHADCPHRVLVVSARYSDKPEILEHEYCTQPATHPEYRDLQEARTARATENHAPDADDEDPENAQARRERDKAEKEQRKVLEEAWKARCAAAGKNRLDWLAAWAKPKRPSLPADVDTHIATWINELGEETELWRITEALDPAADPDPDPDPTDPDPDHALAWAWAHGHPDGAWPKQRAQAFTITALIVALAVDSTADPRGWQAGQIRAVLTILTTIGYTPTPLEQAVLDNNVFSYDPITDEYTRTAADSEAAS